MGGDRQADGGTVLLIPRQTKIRLTWGTRSFFPPFQVGLGDLGYVLLFLRRGVGQVEVGEGVGVGGVEVGHGGIEELRDGQLVFADAVDDAAGGRHAGARRRAE